MGRAGRGGAPGCLARKSGQAETAVVDANGYIGAPQANIGDCPSFCPVAKKIAEANCQYACF
jgi:hypothetical protein